MFSIFVDVWLLCCDPSVRCASPQHTKHSTENTFGKKRQKLCVPYFSEPISSSHRLRWSGECLCLDLVPFSVFRFFSVFWLNFRIAVNIGPVGNCVENKRHRRRQNGTYELSVSSFKYSTVHRVHSSRFAATHSLVRSLAHTHEHDRQPLHVTLTLHSLNSAKVVQLWCESCLI